MAVLCCARAHLPRCCPGAPGRTEGCESNRGEDHSEEHVLGRAGVRDLSGKHFFNILEYILFRAPQFHGPLEVFAVPAPCCTV